MPQLEFVSNKIGDDEEPPLVEPPPLSPRPLPKEKNHILYDSNESSLFGGKHVKNKFYNI